MELLTDVLMNKKCSVVGKKTKVYSILFYPILSYSILFCSILFYFLYSVLFSV